jgi:hypothetical protein
MLVKANLCHELSMPAINNGGLDCLHADISSADFLLDDCFIDSYLTSVEFETDRFDITNDNIDGSSQHQDAFLEQFDVTQLIDFVHIQGRLSDGHGNTTCETFADIVADPNDNDRFEIEKWISEPTLFLSTDTSDMWKDSPMTNEDLTSHDDRTVPVSPSVSSTSTSSMTKRSKLTPVQRRLRKKDQNKTAAEKYRIKKKSERDQLLGQYSKLQICNRELKCELDQLTFQVQQLKRLFSDVVSIPLSRSN